MRQKTTNVQPDEVGEKLDGGRKGGSLENGTRAFKRSKQSILSF